MNARAQRRAAQIRRENALRDIERVRDFLVIHDAPIEILEIFNKYAHPPMEVRA